MIKSRHYNIFSSWCSKPKKPCLDLGLSRSKPSSHSEPFWNFSFQMCKLFLKSKPGQASCLEFYEENGVCSSQSFPHHVWEWLVGTWWRSRAGREPHGWGHLSGTWWPRSPCMGGHSWTPQGGSGVGNIPHPWLRQSFLETKHCLHPHPQDLCLPLAPSITECVTLETKKNKYPEILSFSTEIK